MTSPARARLIKPSMAEIEIHEGKNRIVRRIFEKLGYKVVSLKRTRIGKYTLGSLREGEWKYFIQGEHYK